MKICIKKFIPLMIYLLVLLISCGKSQGAFAVKTINDDAYKMVREQLEFEKDSEHQWIYKFKPVSGRITIGVILLKKELVWVEIKNVSDYIEGKKNILYGSISKLPVGEYRIVLTDVAQKNTIIDELQFVIYSDRGDE